jgi:tetratricopeptide (TPR) repeat protein
LASARQKLAEARAQLGNDHPALGNLAAEIGTAEAALDRFQQFLNLIDRAHQAESAPVLDAGLAVDGTQAGAGPLAAPRRWERRPAEAVPLLLKALALYAVLESDDWNTALGGGLLGRDQVEHIRRTAYDELLWLAYDIAQRQHEHRSGQRLSPEAAARQALLYLGKAASAHGPTQALYALRARCRKALREEAAAQTDQQLADSTAPTIALDHYLRGQAACDGQQLAEGVQAFEAALDLEPTHYWSLMQLGYALCDLGKGPEDFTGAARVFTGCVLKRPDHAFAYYCRANAYQKLRRYKEAVADCTRAIKLEPTFAAVWCHRGNNYSNLGDAAKAITDYSTAIELDPQHLLAWNGRGIAYSNLGELDKAVADFTKAIELDAKFALGWYNRGLTYFKLGQHDKAVGDLSRALELDPNHAGAWYSRAAAYQNLGQPLKALADSAKAIELDPADAMAWTNRGNAYGALGELDKALADFAKAIERNPKLVLAWYNRGVTYAGLGQPDKAVADFARAIDLDPKFALAWYGRGNAYRRLNQPDKAIADLSEAVRLDPQSAPAWYMRGVAFLDLSQWDNAVSDLSRFIALAPNHPQLAQAYLLRAQAHTRLAHLPQARADYEMVLKLAPSNAAAVNELAWLLATCPEPKLRDPARAVELAKKAVQLAPKDGNCRNTLGVAHYRAGDWKAALAALDQSMDLRQGGDAVDWLFLAMAYRQLDNREEARKWFDRAVQSLEKNSTLAKDPAHAEELRRFRSEAEDVLELKKK